MPPFFCGLSICFRFLRVLLRLLAELFGNLLRYDCALFLILDSAALDGGMDLVRAHSIADAVEDELRAAYPGAEVIIHQDPHGVEEPRTSFA